jgi:hypothetical protein
LLNRGCDKGLEPGMIMGRSCAKTNDHGPPVREDARAGRRKSGKPGGADGHEVRLPR